MCMIQAPVDIEGRLLLSGDDDYADNIFLTSKERMAKKAKKANKIKANNVKLSTAKTPVSSPPAKSPQKKKKKKSKGEKATPSPSALPSLSPTSSPSSSPRLSPTISPTSLPSSSPTYLPSSLPSSSPSSSPTGLIRWCQQLRFTDEINDDCNICGGSFTNFGFIFPGQILSFTSPTNGVVPVSIEFVVGASSCGEASSIIVLNGRAQSYYTLPAACFCGDCQVSSVIPGNVAHFNPNLDETNTITIVNAIGQQHPVICTIHN
jgi:hypothetical protein